MIDQTEIVVVADCSGSMNPRRMDMIGGFDAFIAEQQKLDKPAFVTLTQFDDKYEVVYLRKALAEVPSLAESYHTTGNTALNDAVGRTISELGERLAALPEEQRPNKVIFMILTDGQENASREYKLDQIRDMIKHQEEKYNWTFLFVGAGIDAYTAGEMYGMAASKVISGASGSLRNAYAAVSKGIGRSRLKGASLDNNMEFFSYSEKLDAGDMSGTGAADADLDADPLKSTPPDVA